MCFISQTKKLKAHKSEGMFVYKTLHPTFLGICADSVLYRFMYIKNKYNNRINVDLIKSTNGNYVRVEQGYHSYLRTLNIDLWPKEDIYLMEIPKGTYCWINEEGNVVVSENIIMRKRLTYNHSIVVPIYIRVIDNIYDFISKLLSYI